MVTVADIAKAAGVSPSTVSRVVSRKTPVSEKTRLRVEKAIKETGYRPNLLARSLRLKSGNLIGLVVPGLQGRGSSFFLSCIQETTYELGFNLIVGISRNDVDIEADLVDNYIRNHIAGVILSRVSDKSRVVEILEDANVPFVVIDRALEHESVPKVVLNNYRAGELAARHLAGLGHVKIGCISGNLSIPLSRERLNGFHDELARHGIALADEDVFIGDFGYDSGRTGVQHFVKRGTSLSAIWAQNDFMAIGAIWELQSRGIRVPEDLSVVGMDDMDVARMIHPELTTIKQPFDDIARAAVNKIVKMREIADRPRLGDDEEAEEIHDEVISPSLILRRSTAAMS